MPHTQEFFARSNHKKHFPGRTVFPFPDNNPHTLITLENLPLYAYSGLFPLVKFQQVQGCHHAVPHCGASTLIFLCRDLWSVAAHFQYQTGKQCVRMLPMVPLWNLWSLQEVEALPSLLEWCRWTSSCDRWSDWVPIQAVLPSCFLRIKFGPHWMRDIHLHT